MPVLPQVMGGLNSLLWVLMAVSAGAALCQVGNGCHRFGLARQLHGGCLTGVGPTTLGAWTRYSGSSSPRCPCQSSCDSEAQCPVGGGLASKGQLDGLDVGHRVSRAASRPNLRPVGLVRGAGFDRIHRNSAAGPLGPARRSPGGVGHLDSPGRVLLPPHCGLSLHTGDLPASQGRCR